jgi:hypothetical protein
MAQVDPVPDAFEFAKCDNCGRRFKRPAMVHGSQQLYCQPWCQRRAHKKRQLARRPIRRFAPTLGVIAEVLGDANCLHCGTEFTQTLGLNGVTKLYCNPRCADAASAARRRAARKRQVA